MKTFQKLLLFVTVTSFSIISSAHFFHSNSSLHGENEAENSIAEVSKTQTFDCVPLTSITSKLHSMGGIAGSTPTGFTPIFSNYESIQYWTMPSGDHFILYVYENPEDAEEAEAGECTLIWDSNDGSCQSAGDNCKVQVGTNNDSSVLCCD